MPSRHSTDAVGSGKPAKPHKDFPLHAASNGQWAKKVRQKIYYFGVWADPQAALNKWLAEKDDLLAGRAPRKHDDPNAITLAKLFNRFLTTKKTKMDSGELTAHSFTDYFRVCESLGEAFGESRLLTDIHTEDFEKLRASWAKRWGPVLLGNEINRVRVIFNYAFNNGLMDRPMRYGEGFKRPSRVKLRRARNDKDKQLFEPNELRRMIEAAKQPLKSMLLLAINAGFGNSDIGQLPLNAIDLESKWIDYPRPKTEVKRRCQLWPESITALRGWITKRPKPADDIDAHLLFLTVRGAPWHKTRLTFDDDGKPNRINDQPITHATRKLLNKLEIKGNRNFYAIRHTFRTIADETLDQPAVDYVMGHDDESMASKYRERIADERLIRVTDHVRKWLFAEGENASSNI